MRTSLYIDNKEIGKNTDCYVIAEIGNNHGGSLEVCKQMIKIAKECGADAVKLQKRDNRSLYTKSAYDKPYDNPNSYGTTYGEHREFLELDIEAYKDLQIYCKDQDITFFATAFDLNSANQLEGIDLPAYKIASGDLKSIPLLTHIASFGKPMIVSTGGANLEDVKRAFEAIYPINQQLCILQCTAGYPADFENLNLNVIKAFRKEFPKIQVGLSSHDNGIAMALASYILGGRVVEKHFTLNRAQKGTDHKFSLEPSGLRKMVRDLRRAKIALGDGIKSTYPCEEDPIKKMGKCIMAAQSLPKGHIIKDSDLSMKSPAIGLPLYEWGNVVGKRLNTEIREDDLITFDIIE